MQSLHAGPNTSIHTSINVHNHAQPRVCEQEQATWTQQSPEDQHNIVIVIVIVIVIGGTINYPDFSPRFTL